MRSRRLALLLLTLGSSGVVPLAVDAQTSRSHIGPHLAYNFDFEELGLGAQVGIPIGRRLEFYPSFDYYFVDSGSLWAINADIKYRTTAGDLRWLYLGGGLNLLHRSVGDVSNTDAGLNLLAGAESLKGVVHPFGELRVTLKDGSNVQIAAGLNITVGRH